MSKEQRKVFKRCILRRDLKEWRDSLWQMEVVWLKVLHPMEDNLTGGVVRSMEEEDRRVWEGVQRGEEMLGYGGVLKVRGRIL